VSRLGEPEIVEVTSRRQVSAFINLPYQLHSDDPHWVAPLRRDERRRLSASNPFLVHARMRLWLALRDGRVVGRIAAIDDRRHNETHGQPVTWFGFFESDSQETAGKLLDAIERHARQQGSAAVHGPVNPSLNETAGLLVEGFESAPYILMPHNPPGYAAQIERAGYTKLKDLFAWHLDLHDALPDRLARIADRVRDRKGLTLRTLDMSAFERDLAIVQRIYQTAWRDNWGFVAPTDAEVRRLARDLKPIIDPEIVVFAEVDDRAVGFAIAVPDVNQVLRRMRGRLLPFGIIYFLARRSIIDRARLMLLGVESDWQRTGLYPLLIAETHRLARRRGYVEGEVSWTLEDNDAINAGIEASGARRYKTYRLYQKRL
jgi:GNAT superfamily N-acetyltransferase